MIKIITVQNFGLNNIDLEGRVEENETSQGIKTVAMEVSSFQGRRTAFELPPNLLFRVISSDGGVYYAKLDESAVGNPRKIFPNSGGGVTILADEKYDLNGKLETNIPSNVNDLWQIKVTEITGGGGAHNTAYGQQMYLSGISDANINVRLIVPYGHTIIQTKLPQGLEYAPLYGI